MRITGLEPATSSLQRTDSVESAAARDTSTAEAAEKQGLMGPVANNLADGKVTVSERVVEAERVREIAIAEPEVRNEVVERAKADLAAGKMTADPMNLAESIARDLF
ncbi:MAG: hypothetical protein CMP23_17510 [Rickettsiales bacterium]|nr:hypothetical protein [Rickettsiales bacterium]